jgi:hypothetical protein
VLLAAACATAAAAAPLLLARHKQSRVVVSDLGALSSVLCAVTDFIDAADRHLIPWSCSCEATADRRHGSMVVCCDLLQIKPSIQVIGSFRTSHVVALSCLVLTAMC